MSGGVDSAVAAQLRASTRATTRSRSRSSCGPSPACDGTKSCCSPQAVTHARALAHRMGLPHVTLDVRDGFRAERGRRLHRRVRRRAARPTRACAATATSASTRCSALAAKLGAAKLATGHYARITATPAARSSAPPPTRARTSRTCSPASAPDELERLWFPLGELTQARGPRPCARREAARGRAAPRARTSASCPAPAPTTSSPATAPGPAKTGEIVRRGRPRLGEHDGQHRVHRRPAPRASASRPRDPLYVIAQGRRPAAASSVGPARRARRRERVRRGSDAPPRWRRGRPRQAALPLGARRLPDRRRRTARPPPRLELELDEPVLGVAPGQTACLMRGDRVIGWATIAPTARAVDPLRRRESSACPLTGSS